MTAPESVFMVLAILCVFVLLIWSIMTCLIISMCGKQLWDFFLSKAQPKHHSDSLNKILKQTESLKREVDLLRNQVDSLPPVMGENYAKLRRKYV
jgi:hypothetical protein